MTNFSDALSTALSCGRRAALRRWFWGGAAVTTSALTLAPPAPAAEANRTLFDLKGQGVRVVITGNNAAGKSYVIKDERIKSGEIWRTVEGMPLGAGNGADPNVVLPATRESAPGQNIISRWYFSSIPPSNKPFNRATMGDLHRTSSVGYVLFTSGQVTLALDEGEVVMRAGDMLVTRNVMHLWHNEGPEPLGMLIAQVTV